LSTRADSSREKIEGIKQVDSLKLLDIPVETRVFVNTILCILLANNGTWLEYFPVKF
jgi:hypothetical protein